MNLYLIRHAIAQPAENENDAPRPLTEKGRAKMIRIAQGLKTLEVQIDWILTSPYLRAVETAEIVRKMLALKKKQVVTMDQLSPLGETERLIVEVNERFAEARGIALVGHEPSLSGLASTLLGGNSSLALTFKKGSVCCLSVETLQHGRCATLEWLLQPSQLAQLGKVE